MLLTLNSLYLHCEQVAFNAILTVALDRPAVWLLRSVSDVLALGAADTAFTNFDNVPKQGYRLW
jgi:hypothetical protein